jgi:small multidrug resistance pump
MAARNAPAPTIVHWLALVVAIAASQIGQILLKLGATGLPGAVTILGSLVAQLLRWQTMTGLGFYGCGTMLYLVALQEIPMSVALPCTAVSFTTAGFVGALVFGEHMGWRHIIGLAMICTGVILLARTSMPSRNGVTSGNQRPLGVG